MKRLAVFLALFMQFAVSGQVLANDSEFPGRAEFPEVSTIDKAQLKQQLNDVVIVDTRSDYEYDTLRIKGALHISIAAEDFGSKIRKLRKNTDKPIVFYCNGRSCYKSYKAARKSMDLKVNNVYAYDAGMFEWAKTYPEHSVLRNISPISASAIITKQDYTKRLLDSRSFVKMVNNEGAKPLVLDIRDLYQRAGMSFFPGKERWASLDQEDRLNRYLKRAKKENRTVLVYDEVGQQVYWFQYALLDAGIDNFYFLKGGARSYIDMIESKHNGNS